jgi:bacterioferritin (cytochrome b1)
MTYEELLSKLNLDLANEYTHMMFYTVHGSTLVGPNRQVFSDFFKSHAKSEMAHAMAFQDLIVGLGGVPAPVVNPVPVFADAEQAIKHAINMEQEVVTNYLYRLDEVENSGDTVNLGDKLRVKLFLEKQFEDSRVDLEELNNLVVRIK